MKIKVISKMISIIMIIGITLCMNSYFVYGNAYSLNDHLNFENGPIVGVNETEEEEEEVQVETVSPSTENNVNEVLTVPLDSIIFYGGTIIFLSITLLIIIIISKRKSKE